MPADQKRRLARLSRIPGRQWIDYTRASEVLAQMEDLYRAPRIHRMPNLLIIGETNNGKSMIVNRFEHMHRARASEAQSTTVPVLKIQAPPVSDAMPLLEAILGALYQPIAAYSRFEKRIAQVLRIFEIVGVRMLIIDEIQHALASTPAKQRQFLNTVKYIGNELQIPIVAVGTREAFALFNADPQLSNRFHPAVLPRWEMGNDYLRLLASLEVLIDLQTPNALRRREIAEQILYLSEQTIGEIVTLVTVAAKAAIRDESESITPVLLNSCGYVSPSKRRSLMQA